MSVTTNNHEFVGEVLDKFGPIPIKDDLQKSYLYCRGIYLQNGKPKEQDIRVTVFSWGDHRSKIADLIPGYKVSFYFSLNGRFNKEKKDRDGASSCWTEPILTSKVEVLDTTGGVPYDNEPKEGLFEPKDDLGTFDDPSTDLPFNWFIPLILPLAGYLLV